MEDPPLRDAVMPPPPPEFMEARRRDFAALKNMPADERTVKVAALNPGWHALEIEPWAQSKTEVDMEVLKQFGRLDRYPWREAFERMRCPGLLITGDPDKMAIVTPEIAAEALRLWPIGRLIHVGGAGHCVHRDRYEETMAAIDAFLDRQADGAQ
jgi:pimeloyl-ACP methyl ester carboxylesterase